MKMADWQSLWAVVSHVWARLSPFAQAQREPTPLLHYHPFVFRKT